MKSKKHQYSKKLLVLIFLLILVFDAFHGIAIFALRGRKERIGISENFCKSSVVVSPHLLVLIAFP